MHQQQGLSEIFVDALVDIYSAEKQILSALPKMARAAQTAELQEAFRTHRDQTEDQIGRLDQIFELIGHRNKGKLCEAMHGILEEGTETIEEFKGTAALDAGLIASAQTVEHYEIARYTSLKEWASELDLSEAVSLLDETLKEEKETDRLLTELAEGSANLKAQKNGSAAKASGTPAAKIGGQAKSGQASATGQTGQQAKTGQASATGSQQKSGGSQKTGSGGM
jgi:ferritin-like metal-binding protein YciE